jgi:uncharacterized protein (TIGR02001 family)
MKKHLLASVAAAAFASQLAHAQAPAPTPEHTLTGNMAIVSDYRFRGISQTFGEGFFTVGPAIQGGIDYSHSSGFYLGNWNSNVSGNQYPNGSGIEMDFYGGYKHAWGDFGLDVGTIYYAYPGGTKFVTPNGDTDVNNWEVYVGGSWKWFSAKYFYSLTDYFGLSQNVVTTLCNPANSGCTPLGPNGDTKGSSYLMGAFNYEVMPKLTFTATAGYTWVAHYNKLDYFDYKVGLTYDLSGWLLGASIIGTDADKDYWYATNGTGKNREIGTAGLILSIGKTF